MSKIPNNDDGLNDTDFANLFASDNREPPKELDKLILDNALLSQHDSIPQRHESFIQKYAPLFGTAAVLMIAFALTPLVMNAPESASDIASITTAEATAESSLAKAPTAASVQELGNQQGSGASADDSSALGDIAIASSETLPQSTHSAEPTSTASGPALSVAADSVAADTTDTSDEDTIASVSSATINKAVESDATESLTEGDTDALGIDADAPGIGENENFFRESENSDTAAVTLAKDNAAEEIAEAESILDLAKTEIAIDDEVASQDTDQIMKDELIIRAEPAATSESAAESTAESEPESNLAPAPEIQAIVVEAIVESAQTVPTPSVRALNENKLVQEATTAEKADDRNLGAGSVDLADNSTDTLEQQNSSGELQEGESARIAELELLALKPNTLAVDESAQIQRATKRAREQDDNPQSEEGDLQSVKPARVKAKNYRSSALLWVIEIKHLYNEKNIDQAREELALFRKKYPDNSNERLLPKELLKLKANPD